MHQYIGLILLILAVVGAVYVASHSEELLTLRLPLSVNIEPPVAFDYPSAPEASQSSFIEEVSGAEDGYGKADLSSVFDPYLQQDQSSAEQKKLVRISSLWLPTSFSPITELVLSVDLAPGQTVNITDWTVQSRKGSFRIPQAQEVYSFGGEQQDIILHSGEEAHFYSGRGLKGNFRLNKCTGYMEDVIGFAPSLPKSCPYISRSEVEDFTSPCQKYALSLLVCEHPSANPPVPYADTACREFLRKLNYAGCVEQYGNDQNFLSNEWRVWLENRINIFDPVYDKVQLKDKEGNIVDEYVY